MRSAQWLNGRFCLMRYSSVEWTRGGAAQAAAALGALGLAQVAPAGAGAQDLAAGRDLEPLGHGLSWF